MTFEKNLNAPNGILRGSGETDSWKKLEAENLTSDSRKLTTHTRQLQKVFFKCVLSRLNFVQCRHHPRGPTQSNMTNDRWTSVKKRYKKTGQKLLKKFRFDVGPLNYFIFLNLAVCCGTSESCIYSLGSMAWHQNTKSWMLINLEISFGIVHLSLCYPVLSNDVSNTEPYSSSTETYY